MSVEKDIFKRGSTTYFWSSRFFPKNIRSDVFRLYSFVRVADDYVDAQPQDKKNFEALVDTYQETKAQKKVPLVRATDSVNERVAKNMVAVSKRYNFDDKWIDAFIASMQMDLDVRSYKTIEDSLQYTYGSAEVIGLMMAKIMGLSPKASHAAKMQGRAMQWINFVRDIQEDLDLGRQYFPSQDLSKFQLPSLGQEIAQQHPQEFADFVRFQIARYRDWQAEAAEGYRFIPKRLRVPLATAADMYEWTANKIEDNPAVVFEQKVKPSKRRVVGRAVKRVVL